jgi:xylulokinase
MRFILACDIGSTNFRAALLDASGHVAHDIRMATESLADIDPLIWWRQFSDAAEALADAAGPDFAQVAGIAICGATRTQVFLDAAGQPLRPAITWRDARATAEAAHLATLVPPGWAEGAHINAFHPAARLAWLAAHEPGAFARLHSVIDPKDFLNLRLTGLVATDTVSNARLMASAQPWPAGGSLLGALGVPASVGAIPFLAPTAQLGPVRSDLPGALGRLAGVPVFAMGNDTWAMAAGLGALRPGLAYNISGTTEVFGAIGGEPATAPGLMSVDWGAGVQQLGGPSQCGADTVAWLLSLLAEGGTDAAARLDRLLAAPRDPAPALFLPFLQGERVPFWEPMLRGAWLGLHRGHGAGDLAWSVLESVAFLNRLTLERAEAALGAPVEEIRFGGGGSANLHWGQVKADVTGRPVRVGEAAHPGLLGCAIVAWAGLGAFASLEAAQQALVRMTRNHVPDPARHAAYAPHYAAWLAAVEATRPLSATIAALRVPPFGGAIA